MKEYQFSRMTIISEKPDLEDTISHSEVSRNIPLNRHLSSKSSVDDIQENGYSTTVTCEFSEQSDSSHLASASDSHDNPLMKHKPVLITHRL